MPSINIKEVDNTTAGDVTVQDYTVFIPGPVYTGGTWSATDTAKLFTTVAAFTTSVGSPESGDGDVGYQEAIKLLALGMPVLYAKLATTGTFDDTFLTPFYDRGKYDIRFVTCGSFLEAQNANPGGCETVANAAIKCAATRGDAVAIIDVPTTYIKTGTATAITVDDSTKVDAFSQLIGDGVVTRTDSDGNTKTENMANYGAVFSSQVTYASTKAFPASYDYLSCFAYYVSRYQNWYAMAGAARGVSPETIDHVAIDFGDADLATLQKRVSSSSADTHKATNVICNIRPYGYLVWGNRTLTPLGSGLTASSFLNIRHLCCTLKKVIYDAARKFTFEPNSDVLWINFINAISPTLELMKSNQGISGYKITKIAVTTKAVLKAKITIIPIEAVEDFDITVELSDNIATVTE